jgi:hypothetical protein
MTKAELREKIRDIVLKIKNKNPIHRSKFEVVNSFPEILPILVDLMTTDNELFIEDISWVAPRPSTFKIKLKNNQFFFLIFTEKSWIAQVEGKKYYLNNLPEAERASEGISRILKYGENNSDFEGETDLPSKGDLPSPPEENNFEEDLI